MEGGAVIHNLKGQSQPSLV